MTARGRLQRTLHALRRADTAWQRRRNPSRRHVVFDARTAMEYAMVAPLHAVLAADPRVQVSCMSSERPRELAKIYRDAPDGTRTLSPALALVTKVDAYVAADLLWAVLPRGAGRVQMFHGVAGKWSHIYDRPTGSMRDWDRLFFINRRRLQNYVAAGALDPDSPAIRLVGMPKTDCLVDGSLQRDRVLEAHDIDPSRPTVLYAPTWTQHSSLNLMGEDVVTRLVEAGRTVLVKLHENSLDPRHENSGGVDWAARLEPILARGAGRLVRDSSVVPWLVAADVLVTDHSSVGFEYLLRDRPVVRIEMPALLARTNVSAEYVELMAAASTTVRDGAGVLRAVEESLATPGRLSRTRREIALDLFHEPGTATARALRELYALLELPVPPAFGGDAAAATGVPAVLAGVTQDW